MDFSFDDSLEQPEEFGFGHEAINEGSVMNDVQKGKVGLKVFKAGDEQVPGIFDTELTFINELK